MQELFRPDRPPRDEAGLRCRRFLESAWRGFRLTRLLWPRELTERLVPVLAWQRVVRSTERTGVPPRAAEALQELVAELERNEPRSALAVALAPVLRELDASTMGLRGTIAELEKTKQSSVFASRAELVRHARRLDGPATRWLTRVVGLEGERAELQADALALGVRLASWLAELPTDLRAGRLRIAAEDLLEERLDALSFPDALDDPEDLRVQALFQRHIRWARTELAKGWPVCEELGAWRGRQLAFALRWNAATLSAVEAAGLSVPASGVRSGWLRVLACGAASAFGTGVPFGDYSPA